MRLPELQRILIDGARRQERAAGRSRRSRFGGRRALMVALALVLVGGATAGAVISLSPSRPLRGTLPHGPSDAGPSHYRISVFPYMAVGWSGWCSSVVFDSDRSREATDYGCSPVESSGPLVAGGDEFGDPAGEYSYGIVSDAVAYVRLSNGVTLTPVGSPRLPSGTRAYFAVTRQPDRRPLFRPVRLFDAGGAQLQQPPNSRERAVEHLPQLAVNPYRPGTARCALRIASVAHLTASGETVTPPVAWPRHQAGAFLACANATFELNRTRLGVAVLVNAGEPAQPAPPLPELLPDPAHAGVLTGHELGNIGFHQGLSVANFGGGQAFNTPTRHQQLADHDVSARRAGAGWIVVEGGTSGQRALLLAHLSTGA
ncbi:MAG: hypothetical protein JWN10_1309 [Solirubrobacterales bacterium]|nr:hypothetical protein [Solirubrobacterales bacterium]